MFLGFAIVASLTACLALRRNLRALAQLRLRGGSVVLVALAVQLVLFTRIGAGTSNWIVTAAHDATYVGLLAFAAFNARRYPMLVIAGAGVASNAAAITANGGRMPVTLSAWTTPGRAADLIEKNGYYDNNVLMNSHTRLGFLGDTVGLPTQVPFANAVSLGDILILIGITAFVWRALDLHSSITASPVASFEETTRTSARACQLADNQAEATAIALPSMPVATTGAVETPAETII